MFLTHTEYEFLRAGRIVTVHGNRATLTLSGKGQDARFVMEGPSGKHTLLVDATDLNRLNAHWVNFANHTLNAING